MDEQAISLDSDAEFEFKFKLACLAVTVTMDSLSSLEMVRAERRLVSNLFTGSQLLGKESNSHTMLKADDIHL